MSCRCWWTAGVLTVLLPAMLSGADAAPAPGTRAGLAICVSLHAPMIVRQAADRVLAACTAGSNATLAALTGGPMPAAVSDSQVLVHAKVEERAYRHLVLIGLPDDPLIAAAWQHEARAEEGGFYIFGFGHVRGDIGYLESDRNPFLHSDQIASAPYETEVVTITGSTPAGVSTAVDAFLAHGLVNGVVAQGPWTRPSPTLLDRDPLTVGAAIPDWIPATAGASQRIAVSQGGEDEYRGVLADCQVEPRQIWRVKYHHADDWSAGGAVHAIAEYSAGLHRRAYGSTVWLAQFASVGEASMAAPLIAKSAHLTAHGDSWSGAQLPYSSEKESPGQLILWRHEEWLLMSTLAAQDAAALRSAIR